jgi:hypothetical protein
VYKITPYELLERRNYEKKGYKKINASVIP